MRNLSLVRLVLSVLLSLFSLVVTIDTYAQTVLSPGSLIVITANSDAPDSFQFVPLVDLETNTIIYFTDNGRFGDNTWRAGEGIITFTSTESIPAGSILTVSSITSSSPQLSPSISGLLTKSGSIDFSGGGDTLLVYQGSSATDNSASFIFGLGFAYPGVWINTGTPTSNTSYVPAQLQSSSSYIQLSLDNVQYMGTTLGLYNSNFSSDFYNTGNWNGSDSTIYSPVGYSFDAIRPTGSIEYTPPTATMGNVVVLLTGLNETGSVTNNGGSYSYTFSSNGTFGFELLDTAGNTGLVTASVDWIVSTPGSGGTILSPGGTILSPGDIIITTINSYTIFSTGSCPDVMGKNNGFEFVNRVPINTGTVLYFTDNGWKEDNTWRNTEGTLMFTAGSFLPIGTKIYYNDCSLVSLPDQWKKFGFWDPAIAGDTLLVYQGLLNDVDPDFIYGIAFGAPGVWINNGTVDSSNRSYIPGTLMSGITAIYPVLTDNGQYNCSLNYDTTSSTFLTDLADPTHWSGFNGSIVYGATSCNYTDQIAPVVSLSGLLNITLAQGGSYSEGGAEWIDNADGSGFITTANSGTVNTNIVGTYLLEYRYVDSAGNTGNIVTRTVHVTDQTAPVVSLSGLLNITLAQGGSYSEGGAEWIDNVDGSGFIAIASSGIVNTNIVGTYLLEYRYVDSAGNTGNIVTRTVTIQTNSSGGGNSGGGGGGSTIVRDNCPEGDYSYSYYDRSCGTKPNTITGNIANTGTIAIIDDFVDDVVVDGEVFENTEGSSVCVQPDYTLEGFEQLTKISEKRQFIVCRLYHNQQTVFDTVEEFDYDRIVAREEASRMITNFVKNVLHKEPMRVSTDSLCQFRDFGFANPGLVYFMIDSCRYGIFNGTYDHYFLPKETLNQAHAIATVLRSSYGYQTEKKGSLWFAPYIDLLQEKNVGWKGLTVLDDMSSLLSKGMTRGSLGELMYRVAIDVLGK